MTTAPSTHTAKFFNGDWVQLAPWYYDPLHDYAFFKYEPSMLKTKPIEIELAPEKARRNTEFMVVGNDNGEKLSSAVGYLDDVMRGPPEYSSNGLELVDVNTVYYTSLTMNSRGSSGAPVLDVDGKALAIVGGGSSSSRHIMMLPLHQAKKTLAILQDGELPPRGTIQAVLVRKEPSELERIGFPVDEVIAMSGEFRKEKGLLQIESTVPRGPAFQKLMQGDVLALADGKPVSEHHHCRIPRQPAVRGVC
ncbi:hypothetical protein DL89DRAFT_263596 [Linderina pennispora]|uniref:PDZ domain-containing protein n=1 Tax=Linderina pennispora TaxID=61395 RepID=A0A1Y1WJ28_9FUNG|nr:uncharacterized protein DL89DRAFT_263596 [Linderina pennispora]ORX73539.1 hypothetical protein DL89DRAFT_263596 [Linderina pennispora]